MLSLRFLADESCDYLIVRSLRAAGHDVIAVVDEGEQSVDAAVIDQAYVDRRILLTEDKDFGWQTQPRWYNAPSWIATLVTPLIKLCLP